MKRFGYATLLSVTLVLLLLVLGPASLLPATPTRPTFAALPLPAQALVNHSLGQDNPGYHMHATADGYDAVNASHSLQAHFSEQGIQLTAANTQWTLTLQNIE